jgi:hypothetical protein
MTLAAAALASTGAGAEIIRKEEMLHALTTTRERCAATDETRPVVFLSGDHFGTVRNWQRVPVSKDKDASVTFDPTNRASHGDVSTDDLAKTADACSKLAKTTAIYLARIGVDGTSANHVFRKTVLEPHPMGAALDAIKHRYGFKGFHLARQSGTLVTGLAGTRHAGRLGMSGGGSSKEPARTLADPLGSDRSIAHNRAVHFFMISDSADRSVPAGQQTPFAETDDFHVDVSELVTAGCALGKSDAQVAAPVGTPVKRNAACDEQRRQEIPLFGKNGTARPSAEPGADRPARTGGKRA